MSTIKKLPKTPTLPPDTSDNGKSLIKTLWDTLVNIYVVINQLIEKANTDFTLPAHKDMHAVGGGDVLSPADIGAAIFYPGELKTFAIKTPPTGWLKCNGYTIGNASSGATARANADTINLFTALWLDWDNTVLPIQNSAGVATTRGLSAVADFNANKRLPVPDIRGEFVRAWDDGRGVDAGRVFGSSQAQDFKSLSLQNSRGPSYAYTHDYQYIPKNGSENPTGIFGGEWAAPSGEIRAKWDASEIRPRNIALSYFIRY